MYASSAQELRLLPCYNAPTTVDGLFTMNKQLTAYLDYYFNLTSSPGFAIMINGGWGGGKTWYISKFCEDLKYNKLSIFNISLYGLNNVNQIDDEIFKQAHPLLSNKGVVFAGALTKAALKATVRLDLDGDKKDDVNLSLSIPSMDFKKIAKDPTKNILIFDDLERTSIPLNELMGYINHFVERNGCKVVLIANENEIKNTDEKYIKIKEKLIGVTFCFRSNISDAYYDLISSIENPILKSYFEEFKEGFMDVYFKSNCTNFRLFKNFIMDFERFFDILDLKIKQHNKTIEKLLYIYFVFFFETKQNGLCTYGDSMFYSSDETKLTVSELNAKYQTPLFVDMLLSSDTWTSLMNNEVDAEKINKEISASKFYYNPVAPEWVKLWSFNFLNDDEFLNMRDIVLNQLKTEEFTNANVIRHVVGLMLELSKNSLLDFSPDQIIKLGIKCAKNAFEKNKYEPTEYSHGFSNSWGGLGVYSSDSSYYAIFSSEIDIFDQKMKTQGLTLIASEIFLKMKNSDNSFIPMLAKNNVGIRSYHEEPVLKFIPLDQFIDFMLNTNHANRSTICYNFSERYRMLHPESALLKEYDWFKSFVAGLKGGINILSEQRCLTKHNLNIVLGKYLEPALNKFDEIIK